VSHDTKVSAKATGKKDIGTKATGSVTLVNEWDSSSHTFAAGTVIKAKNGNQYVLNEDSVLPGATSSVVGGKSVITPGKKAAAVTAAAAGDAYNIAATTFTIPSLPAAQQEKIYATSDTAFTGGTSKVVTVVTQTDYDTLVSNAKTLNIQESVAALKTQDANAVVLDKVVQNVSQDVVPSAKVNDQADTLEVTIKGSFKAITFTQADLQALLEKVLADKIPQGQKLITSGDGVSLDTSQFELVSATDTHLDLTSNIKAFTVKQFEEGVVRRSLIGAKPTDAKSIVEKYVPVNDVQISLAPHGWPFLPFISSRMTVTYQYAAQK
jgi:hypothetical protein